MKRNNIIGLLATVLLLSASCTNHHVTIDTTINEDGSCIREYTISVKIAGGQTMDGENMTTDYRKFNKFEDFTDQTMAFDDSWQKSWSHLNNTARHAFPADASSANDTLQAHAIRHFASVDEMNSNIPLLWNGKPYNVKGELRKTFKWFYTEYTYTETYASLASEFSVPCKDYVDEETMRYWFTGKPDMLAGMAGYEASEKMNDLSNRMEEWGMANLIYDWCDIVAENYDSLQNAPLTRQEFLDKRPELVKYAKQESYGMTIGGKSWEDMMNEFFKSDVYGKMFAEGTPYSNRLGELIMEKYGSDANYEYRLHMPGTIMSASSGMFDYGVAVFRISPQYMFVGDYVITATSQVTNYWAYIISILVITLAIGSFIYNKKG